MDKDGKSSCGLAKTAYTAPGSARRSDWELLNRLRKISIFKIGYAGMIAVPLASLLILQWNRAFPASQLDLPLHLFCLFLGSFLLSVANLLSEVFCPPLVGDYGRLENYRLEIAKAIEQQNVIFQASRITFETFARRLAEDMLENKEAREVVIDALASNFDQVYAGNDRSGTPDLARSDYEKRWQVENDSKPLVRTLILIAYGAAGALVLYPIGHYLVIVSLAAFPILRG